jgi:hypothetical protein
VKSADAAHQKWLQNTAASAGAWVSGVEGTTVDVMGRAVAAIPAAIQGYTQSLQSGAYAKAVQASGGTANWKAKVSAKSANFAVGVNAGASKQQSAIGKIMQAMPGIVSSLQPRGPAGSPQNYARSAAVGTALHARKGDFKG